ncbi:P-loop containing nucleoside triphosphate hydrolase protein [Russula emetica]|nr:P-loop containing nucleoside triphosphate hydrolase protein [Russula emetica]
MATDTPLSSIPGISHSQQSALKKGGFVTVSDFLLFPFSDISQRCRLAPQAVQAIVDSIAHALARPPSILRDVMRNGSELITTGDTLLDEMLGGGIRVGMVWEFVGESGAGKTQLALQLSLLVQLPIDQGGLNGSACYLTTSSSLPTPRLIQLLHEHPLLAGSRCTLDNIQTRATKSVSSLLHALSEIIPASINAAKGRPAPLKLLIIDSLADLLMEDAKISTTTLADRSRNLSAIAAQLHALASTYQLAVVAINRVTDVWDRRPDADMGFPGELIYADHARLFGRAEGDGGAFSKKSAALGLVWANQVNARIMLTRTEQRHHYYDYRYDRHNRIHGHSHSHHHGAPPAAAAAAATVATAMALPSEESHDRKRQRLDEDDQDVVQVVVRRLTVIFSSVCAPASVDFVVTSRGVEMLVEDLVENAPAPAPALAPPTTLTNVTMGHATAAAASEVERPPPPQPPLAEVSPLDVGSVVGDFRPPQSRPQVRETSGGEVVEDEDEDTYWREVEDFPFSSDNIDLVHGTNSSS